MLHQNAVRLMDESTILALPSTPSSFSSLDISRHTSHIVGLSVRLPICCKVGVFNSASDTLGLPDISNQTTDLTISRTMHDFAEGYKTVQNSSDH